MFDAIGMLITLENFLMLLAGMLFFHCAVVLGKYFVFDKTPRLSKICPQLDNIEELSEEEKDYERIRAKLVEATS